MATFSLNGTTVDYDESTLAFTITRDGKSWSSQADFTPVINASGHKEPIPFTAADAISHERRSFGTGEGVASTFTNLDHTTYSFETLIWIEASSGDVVFEWIPLNEHGLSVSTVLWPAPFAFEEGKKDWITLIPHAQGTMIPNTWPTATAPIPFDGRFLTEGGTMPWYAQLRGDDGYIAICETPWNAGYHVDHPAGGPYTHVSMWLDPSLGDMDYRRVVRVRLRAGASITSLAKEYRSWADEHGHLRTLAEKAARNPSVRDLIGRMWLHVGTKVDVQPDSRLYDAEHPERNRSLTTFGERVRQLRELKAYGVDNIFMHLDGWGQPGYDNQHPDFLPPCKEAGGWDGLKELVDTAHECGYMFGLHDQYRDYFFRTPSFDRNNAVRLPDGTIPEHAMWAGGHQTYLCARLAPDYVKRNYRALAQHGIDLDCTYLDVFTCNEGDECANPEHRMTRRECYEMRGQCFEWLLAHGILTSSEEASDWAMESLVFCHYAPYDFQLAKPDAPRDGVPVPLQNLVYHDCVIEPWIMERIEGGEDHMLYAVLNGGAPYFIRDAAYSGLDGDMGDAAARQRLEEDIARCQTVCQLHKKVGMLEMTGFEFVGDDWNRQRSTFADGTQVTVDFDKQTYEVA